MKTFFVSAAIALISLTSSCSFVPAGGYASGGYRGGMGMSGPNPYGGPRQTMGGAPRGGQVQHHQRSEGYTVQRRTFDGKPKGDPVYVPPGQDYHSVMEKGLHHNMKKPQKVNGAALQSFLSQQGN